MNKLKIDKKLWKMMHTLQKILGLVEVEMNRRNFKMYTPDSNYFL